MVYSNECAFYLISTYVLCRKDNFDDMALGLGCVGGVSFRQEFIEE